jgi:hypothetical protein
MRLMPGWRNFTPADSRLILRNIADKLSAIRFHSYRFIVLYHWRFQFRQFAKSLLKEKIAIFYVLSGWKWRKWYLLWRSSFAIPFCLTILFNSRLLRRPPANVENDENCSYSLSNFFGCLQIVHFSWLMVYTRRFSITSMSLAGNDCQLPTYSL